MSTGGTRFIHEVLQRLAREYTVTIVVEKSSPEWKKNFIKDNISVIETGSITSTSLFYWLFFPFFLVSNYVKLRRLIKPDAIVVSSMFPFNYLGSVLSKKHIYYCFEPFAFFYDDELMREQGQVKYLLLLVLKTLYSWIDKIGVTYAQLVLAINPSVGAHITKIYSRKPDSYTYLGVDVHHFVKSSKKKNAIFTFFHSTDYTLLKGTQYLVKTLKYLKKYQDRFKVIISDSVTNSKLKDEYKKILAGYGMNKNVVFMNHIPYKELPMYYSQSDCYLFLGNPASQGATAASLSVLEAQSCGLPVIRSIGNSDEILQPKTGFYVDPRKSRELAKTLIAVIKKRDVLNKMSKNCISHIRKKYTWDRVVKCFIQSIVTLE